MKIQHFFDPNTWTLSYVVWDEGSKIAVVIDPVADYDPKAVRVTHDSAEKIAKFIDEHDLKLTHVLDTHVHADHLTGMPFFKQRYGAKTVIGSKVGTVLETFRSVFGLPDDFPVDGSQFDILLDAGESLDVGPFQIEAIPTPGHTPASMTYKIEDALFVGDLLFQPDSGAARCDFPGGSAAEEYDSIRRLFELPEETRVFTCHDYQPGGRELAFESTIGEQRKHNVHVNDRVTREEFVALRKKLEDGKELPTLLFQSLQVNIRAGELPEPEANGMAYLKLPLNAF
ncbi:MAG: MBL fold metallo-hydrolase [Planctomycetes bacterium]|nr:MBL fold metallo-hydrolase [Planctomycetota bacterium]